MHTCVHDVTVDQVNRRIVLETVRNEASENCEKPTLHTFLYQTNWFLFCDIKDNINIFENTMILRQKNKQFCSGEGKEMSTTSRFKPNTTTSCHQYMHCVYCGLHMQL